MKKKRVAAIVCICAVAVLSAGTGLLLHLSAGREVERLERQYEALRARVEEAPDASQQAIQEEYARLFEGIAQGDARHAERYVALMEKIGQGTIDVNVDNVFSVAQVCAQKSAAAARGETDWGVQQIQVTENEAGELCLRMDYMGLDEYCVERLEGDEPTYSDGEKPVPNDGALGQTRLLITFPEGGLSQKFLAAYPAGETHVLSSASAGAGMQVRMQIATIPDDSVEGIYIGFDGDGSAAPLGRVETGAFEGSVLLPLAPTA